MTLPLPRRPFSTPLHLALLVYLLALVGLGGYLFWPRTEPSILRVTSARLAPEGDRILLEGEGFGPATQVSLSLDVTDRRLLRHSVPTWGRGGEMVRVGNLLYALVQKKGLLILDLSEPLRPQVISTFVLQEMMRAVVVEDGVAYIACDQAGLVLVDVRNPLSPQRLSFLPDLVRAQGLAIREGRLYAAVTGGKVPSALAVVDVADPARPRLLGRVPLPGQPLGVTIWRDRLLVAAGKAGLVEMDLGEGLPRIRSRLALPGVAHSLLVAEDQAYLACTQAGLVVVDLTGEQPRLSHQQAVKFQATRLALDTGRLYLAGSKGQGQVFDLQWPGHPQWLGSFDAPGIGGLAAYGQTVYLNSTSRRVQVLELAEPTDPLPVKPSFGEEVVQSVHLENNLVVLTTKAGHLHLLERGAGRDIHWLASFPLRGASTFFRIHSGFVYAQIDTSGLEVIDIRSPKHPVAVGYYPVLWGRKVTDSEKGRLAFSPRKELGAFVDDSGLLQLFDAAEPNQLQVRPGPQLPAGIYKLAWGENALYAATSDGNRIIAITSPTSESPEVHPAFILPTQTIKGISLMGEVVVVACGLEGLLTVDVSNPAAPRLLAVQPLPINADFLQLDGTTAHVADARGEILQLDLSDPAYPKYPGLLVETADLQNFAVNETHAFLAAGNEGLQIVPLPQVLQPLSRTDRLLRLALPPIDTPGHYTLRVTDGSRSVTLPGVLELGGSAVPLAQRALGGVQ